jgi:tetratricopeptide (TPR) repeat protein
MLQIAAMSIACIIVVAGLCPDAGADGRDELEIAKAHFKTGQVSFAAGRYLEAAHEFEASYELVQRTELLFNIGRAYEAAGEAAAALDAYRRYRQENPPASEIQDLDARITHLTVFVAHLAVDADVVGAVVRIDGQERGTTPLADVELAPRRHEVSVVAEGQRAMRATVELRPGEHRALRLTLRTPVASAAPAGKPLYKKW